MRCPWAERSRVATRVRCGDALTRGLTAAASDASSSVGPRSIDDRRPTIRSTVDDYKFVTLDSRADSTTASRRIGR